MKIPIMPCQKLVVDGVLQDIRRRKKPDSSEFTLYDRSSGTRSRIDWVYTDIKIANKIKIDHIMVSFNDHHNAISLDRLLSKSKTGKG